jgi:hypothetical protein
MATPIYVDPSRPDDSGDGTTPATAKQTIGAAITVVDGGGTIKLIAGTYADDTSQTLPAKSFTIEPNASTGTITLNRSSGAASSSWFRFLSDRTGYTVTYNRIAFNDAKGCQCNRLKRKR